MRQFALLAAAVLVAMSSSAMAVEEETEPKGGTIAADYDAAKRAIARQDWKLALEALERAVREEPNDADVHNLLGYSYRKTGKLDLAFKHYGRALELNPRHLGAHEYVGEAWLTVGNLAKAREHLAALDRHCPAQCEEREDLKKAIRAFEQTRAAKAR